MNRRDIGIAVAALIAAGFAGGWIATTWPLLELAVHARDANADTYNRATLVVMLMSTVATGLAVIVALFKSEIRAMWDRPVPFIVPRYADSGWLAETCKQATQASDGGQSHVAVAEEYRCELTVENRGRKPLRPCEVFVEQVEFISSSPQTNRTVDVAQSLIETVKDIEPTIAPGRHLHFVLFRVSAPMRQQPRPSREAAAARVPVDESTPATLTIAGHVMPESSGTWVVIVAASGETGARDRFALEICWTGRWESRLADIRPHLKVRSPATDIGKQLKKKWGAR